MSNQNMPAAFGGKQAASQATAIEQSRAVAEVQGAIFVARQFPRDMQRVYDEMHRLCSTPELAARAFYKVPNRGEGPTVHLMRELARVWGNLDYGVKELSRDNRQSEVQAFAWDQEKNTRTTRSFIQPHKRSKGKSTVDLVDLNDIYLSNQNTGARAVRECIQNVLPVDFVEKAKAICQQTLRSANGTGEQLQANIRDGISAYTGLGVTQAQLEQRVGRPAAQWSAQDLAGLQVMYQSIQNRETSVADEFPNNQQSQAEQALMGGNN